ncbi:hypothetical protein KSS87_005322 [Heliosperma pusillum]|nr:hypothetical protein KSS87_005322 [Heliosperma pusillum]
MSSNIETSNGEYVEEVADNDSILRLSNNQISELLRREIASAIVQGGRRAEAAHRVAVVEAVLRVAEATHRDGKAGDHVVWVALVSGGGVRPCSQILLKGIVIEMNGCFKFVIEMNGCEPLVIPLHPPPGDMFMERTMQIDDKLRWQRKWYMMLLRISMFCLRWQGESLLLDSAQRQFSSSPFMRSPALFSARASKSHEQMEDGERERQVVAGMEGHEYMSGVAKRRGRGRHAGLGNGGRGEWKEGGRWGEGRRETSFLPMVVSPSLIFANMRQWVALVSCGEVKASFPMKKPSNFNRRFAQSSDTMASLAVGDNDSQAHKVSY